jgi:ribosomal protein S18 acetylase RimI-like enzyme
VLLKIKLRRASWEDYPFCYALARTNMFPYYKKHKLLWESQAYRKEFDPAFVRIIEYGNKRIGFCKLIFKENYGYLSDLQLSASMQGQGIGTMIMKIIEKPVLNKGYKQIKLRVFPDNPALKLYLRLGYKKVELDGKFYLMQKKL